jgi:hypothetical protein
VTYRMFVACMYNCDLPFAWSLKEIGATGDKARQLNTCFICCRQSGRNSLLGTWSWEEIGATGGKVGAVVSTPV